MLSLIFLLTVICLSLSSSILAAQDPALKLRITRQGLNYANQMASNILNQEIGSLHIPDTEEGDVKAFNIHITQFRPPSYVYALKPPSTFSWGFNNGGIEMAASVRAKKRIAGIKVQKTVDVEMKANAVNILISAAFGLKAGGDGQPTIVSADCHASIGDLDLKISGGILGWIVNLFRGLIARKLKPAAENAVCSKAKEFMMTSVNEKLASFPVQTKVGKVFDLDYGLVLDPVMTADYMEVGLKGRVSHHDFPGIVSPYPSTPLAADIRENKMIFAWVSDKIVNDVFYIAHQTNMTSRHFDDTDSKIGPYLKFQCNKMCLGSLVPSMTTMFPNVTAAELTVATASAPSITVNADGTASLNASAKMDLYAPTPTKPSIIAAELKLGANLRVTVENMKLVGQVNITELSIHTIESKLDKAILTTLEAGVPAFIKPLLEEKLKEVFESGVPIPMTKGVSMINPQIRLLKGTAQVESDVSYTR